MRHVRFPVNRHDLLVGHVVLFRLFMGFYETKQVNSLKMASLS